MQRIFFYLLCSLFSIAVQGQVISGYTLSNEGNNVLKVSSIFDSDGTGNLVQDNSSVSIFVPVGLTDPVATDLQGGNWSINEIDNTLLGSVCGSLADGYYLLQISTNGQANLGIVTANMPEDLFTLSFSGNSSDPINGYDPTGGDALSTCVKGVGVDNTASIDVDGNAGPAPTIGYSNVPIPPNGVVLPVKLLAFTAKAIDNTHAQLHWVTEEERNADYFQLERSTDNRYWQAVGQVKAAAPPHSTEQHTYNFLDKNVYNLGQPTTFYYRLQIVDFDGYTEYSDLRHVRFEDKTLNNTLLYPNPTNGRTTLQLPPTATDGQLEIYTAGGQLLWQQPLGSSPSVEFDTARWPAGLYLVRCKMGQQVVHHQLEVIH